MTENSDDTLVGGRRLIEELRSKKKGRTACVIVIAGPNIGEMHPLQADSIVGRQADAWLCLTDSEVSRHHAKFEQRGDAVFVQDLGSTNGTFVNDQQVTEQQLSDGDKIQIGATTVLKFSYHDDVEREFQEQMYESALRDGLTGAYNKKHFLERLDSEFAFAKRHGMPVVLFMVDIDCFKDVNDTWGHLAGDYVLTTLTQQLLNTIRREDVLGRYGGDEFALITRGITLTEGNVLADRIRQKIERKEYRWEKRHIPVTVSMGVAWSETTDITDPKALLAAADGALYAAKQNGRNQVQLHTSE